MVENRKRGKGALKPVPSIPEILTRDEVAELLRISNRTVDYLVAARAIPFKRIGKRLVRFERQAVMKWFRQEYSNEKGG